MDELPLYTLIHNQYQVLDHTGRLPFSIVFGLCRKSSEDTDPRALILDTVKSALDVPYALANNLMKLQVEDPDLQEEAEIAISRLTQFGEDETYLTLPSPVDREGNWKTGIVTYRYEIKPNSELASIFKPGKKYEFRFASEEDLGIKWYAYGDSEEILSSGGRSNQETEKRRLVSRPSHGTCRFEVVSSLPQPPKLHTKLELAGDTDNPDNTKNSAFLKITTTNTDTKSITVQTRGHQRYLVPWGPMQPEETDTIRYRVIDSSISTPMTNSSILIVDKTTDSVVRKPPPFGPSGPGVPKDPRPKLEILVTVKPEIPLIRFCNISGLLEGLEDGTYRIRLEARGMWWCEGDQDEFAQEEDDRVPYGLWNPTIPPAILESEDVVEVNIKGGNIVR